MGGNILAASGFANQKRLDAIRANNIFYEKPERGEAYRNIQISNTGAAVLISLGDGAYPGLLSALEHQANYRTPVVNFIQNNSVAIGVEANEVVAEDKLYQKGHGKGIPGIRIDETDMDGMYLAMQFATQRALLDAGPTIVEAMTQRLGPHSNAHGDHITSEYVEEIKVCLEEHIKKLPQGNPERDDTERFVNEDLCTAYKI